jgi:hypothetical protein
LACVPVLVEQCRKFLSSRESGIIPLYISSLLEPQWDAIAERPSKQRFADYRSLVMNRYSELKERFKTERVIVLEGEMASVQMFATLLLQRLGQSDFNQVAQPFLRRRFEASTGLNCSAFFREKRFQALSVASLLEEVVEGGQLEKYEPGVRYFFGHRVPD